MPVGGGVTVRRLLAFLVCLVVAFGGTACGRSKGALGGGPDVDACGGYDAYDELPEPAPTDADEVLAWTAGFLRVLERIDADRDVRDREKRRHEVPKSIVTSLDVLERSITKLQTRVKAAAPKGEAAVRQATDSLTRDAAFTRADRALGEFRRKTCR